MPHLRLEYSANLPVTQERLRKVFARLHKVLVDRADAEFIRCQSRAICYEHFYVGDGAESRAFVYLQAILLQRRTALQLQQTGEGLLKVLQDEFKDWISRYDAQISVHLNEIPADRSYKADYYKQK